LLNAKRAALGLSAGFICPAFLILGKKHRPETVQTVVENTTTCFEFYRDTAHDILVNQKAKHTQWFLFTLFMYLW